MKTQIPCPPVDDLRHLIDGSLSAERQQECTAHMDSCECCQAKIEALAVEGSNLSDVIQHLGESEPVAASAYWPALKELDIDAQQTMVPQSPLKRLRELSLDFLQPATDPAYLGRLSHFDVMRVLGRGGMGVVFEAFDTKLQRSVALKVLDPELVGDETARQRFCREARAAASITHENVVAVHQVERAGGDNGIPYLVMQLITGESLEQRLLSEEKLPFREIVRITMQAAHGLAAAHAQGLIHRDIKPGNILLEPPHDRVKLTDFGLARAAEDVKLTRTGAVTGTPLYMAPEQAMGEQADHRSDLFSLGAILYEMCTGQPPFTGNSALAILKQIVDAKHRPLRELNPQIPKWFAETVDKLLAKKPEDRLQSAAQLAELMDFEWALMKTTSEEVPVVCQIEEQKRAVRNRRIAIAIGGTFLAVGLAVGAFFARGTPQAEKAVSSAEPVAVLSGDTGSIWSVSFNPSSDTIAMAIENGKVGIWDLNKQSVKSIFQAHRSGVWASLFSHTGKLLATASDDNSIKLWDLTKPEPIRTYKHTNAVRSVVFSPDDKTVYAGDRDGNLRVWSVESDKPVREAQQAGAIYSMALSPDNDILATAGSDGIIRIWNAQTLTSKFTLEGHKGPVYSVSFSKDGTRLASSGWDHMVRIWNMADGKLVTSWEAHPVDVWGAAFSPDGKKLATGANDGSVKIWDIDTHNLLATYLGHKVAIHTIAFNRDGTLLASGGRDGAVRIWKIQ
ncbi:MAG: serine/threonine-protein kinase [Planctomycetales bacterium]